MYCMFEWSGRSGNKQQRHHIQHNTCFQRNALLMSSVNRMFCTVCFAVLFSFFFFWFGSFPTIRPLFAARTLTHTHSHTRTHCELKPLRLFWGSAVVWLVSRTLLHLPPPPLLPLPPSVSSSRPLLHTTDPGKTLFCIFKTSCLRQRLLLCFFLEQICLAKKKKNVFPHGQQNDLLVVLGMLLFY